MEGGRASYGETGISPTCSPSTSIGIPLSTPLVSAVEESFVDPDAQSVGFSNRYRYDTASTHDGPATQKICDSDLPQLAFSVRLPTPEALPRHGTNTAQSPCLCTPPSPWHPHTTTTSTAPPQRSARRRKPTTGQRAQPSSTASSLPPFGPRTGRGPDRQEASPTLRISGGLA